MTIDKIFIIISTLLTVICILPYILDVAKKKTKPRIVSWFNWSILSAIAGAASLSDGQYAAAILSFSATAETMAVVILGWRNGDKKIVPFDIACQVAAAIGLVLWWVLNSPAIAVAASVLIDLVVSLPTIKHAWEKPHEETTITFFLAGLAAVFTLMATDEIKITSVANPIYIVSINFLLTAILLFRGNDKITGRGII